MATLNMSETEQLQNAKTLLNHILNNGYKAGDQTQVTARIKKSIGELNTVVSMKGYFPK